MAEGKKLENIDAIKSCPGCGSANIIKNKEKHQVICKDCGLIYEPLASVEKN